MAQQPAGAAAGSVAPESAELVKLVERIRAWAAELGFAQLGVTDTDLSEAARGLGEYLDAGHHGTMDWMQERARMRTHPEELHPGTIRVISLRMDYASRDIG